MSERSIYDRRPHPSAVWNGDHEPDYEAIFNDRREEKQADMEHDPTLNP